MPLITLHFSKELLEMVANCLPEDARPPHPYDLLDLEHQPSLHDMFDIVLDSDVGGETPEIELDFPETLVNDALDYFASSPISIPSDSSPVSPDLCCHESPLSSVSEAENEDTSVEKENQDFKLDCPDYPGVNCTSCDYHRQANPEAVCSLCYMRATSHLIFGKLCGSGLGVVYRVLYADVVFIVDFSFRACFSTTCF